MRQTCLMNNLELIKAKNDSIAEIINILLQGEGHLMSPGDLALRAIDIMEMNVKLRLDRDKFLTVVE